MKFNLAALAALLCAVLLFPTCDNELDLTTPWEDIPVVYGLLSIEDTVHYVRVEKAFLDAETSALELATIADSIYYGPEVTVSLRRESTGQTFEMDRIDGATVGIPRAEGIFANTPNIIYALDAEVIDLQANEQVTLIIDRPGAGEATATTTMLGVVDKGANGPPAVAGNAVTFTENGVQTFSLRTTEAARVYETKMLIRVREFVNGISQGDKLIEWQLESQIRADDNDQSSIFYDVDNNGFFSALSSGLEVDSDIERDIVELVYIIIGGSQELDDFLSISSANTGITSAQERPTFSNLEGGEGIFGSIYRFELGNIGVSNNTLFELRDNPITSGLNF